MKNYFPNSTAHIDLRILAEEHPVLEGTTERDQRRDPGGHVEDVLSSRPRNTGVELGMHHG